MAAALMGPILAVLLAIWPPVAALGLDAGTGLNPAGGGVLAERLADWPEWSLPAPLPRPGRRDLVYPDVFEGTWEVRSEEVAPGSIAPLTYRVRFARNRRGELVGDRAFNAAQVGKALLGPQLLTVANDPANPNRQLATLQGDLSLESTVVGRRTEAAAGDPFIADELALQVVHGPGGTRISRVETLTRYELAALPSGPGPSGTASSAGFDQPGRLRALQWQATYPSPEDGLAAVPLSTHRFSLDLQRIPTTPLPASEGQVS
ncbi:MAG: POLO box duplicated region [Cyanobium sp.]|uniref:DUF6816 family protein n=1 Tax=Synechococcus sp. CS-1333 TaxID=2848638 RepID=UPI000DBC2591|nr:POLO box duplicated region [Synechococcus sp. CS-1333]MCT0210961.1 POLO box duplicated region [Synechococcus sp. CS-1333]PZV22449.1 MAG: POLO box duplicated region [Cyanobium sp.]